MEEHLYQSSVATQQCYCRSSSLKQPSVSVGRGSECSVSGPFTVEVLVGCRLIRGSTGGTCILPRELVGHAQIPVSCQTEGLGLLPAVAEGTLQYLTPRPSPHGLKRQRQTAEHQGFYRMELLQGIGSRQDRRLSIHTLPAKKSHVTSSPAGTGGWMRVTSSPEG